MAFDTKKWLVEDLGFSAEDAEAVLPKFEGRADKLEKGQLRQSDYSRQMNDLGKAKQDLDTANERLNTDMAEWATLTEAEKQKSGDLRASLETSQQRILKLEQRITRAAEDAGVDPKTWLEAESTPAKKEVPVFDASALEQQVNNRIGGVAKYMMTLQAKLPKIQREHLALTGEELDVDAFISGIESDLAKNKTDNLDPIARWESQNNIAQKRADKAEQNMAAREAAAEERGRISARSEAMLPNQRPVGDMQSPVLRSIGPSKLQRPQPTDRMARAREALASGKYKGYKMPTSA